MLDSNIPPKLVRFARAAMQNSRGQVRLMGELTNSFEIKQGLEQRDGQAPTLFNLVLERVTHDTKVDVNSTIVLKSQQITGYADDLNMLGSFYCSPENKGSS